MKLPIILAGNRLVLFFPILLFICSCGVSPDKDQLIGQWKAIEYGTSPTDTATVTFDSNSSINLSFIRLRFTEEGRYTYQGGPKYQEAGTYELRGSKIFLQDTTGSFPASRPLLLLSEHPDTLRLQMKNEKQQNTLVLIRD
jgi:hypothetical protein